MKDRELLFCCIIILFLMSSYGRGIYDYEYIDYTIRVLVKCCDYGFKILMDPHQDTVHLYS